MPRFSNALRSVARNALFFALLAAIATAPVPAGEAPAHCRYGEPRKLAAIQDGRVAECSGIAASRVHAGLLWTHNDSGDGPRLFAVDMEGQTRAVVLVQGASARDWEDIAAGPGPDGRPSLFIGDIGNNSRNRSDLVVYCIPEPELPAGLAEVHSETALAFPYRYPDGQFDAEALMVHPHTGDVYIIAKTTTGQAGVYRFPRPLQPGREVILERVATLSLQRPLMLDRTVTAADIAPDGRRCVVRTYFSVLEFRAPEGMAFEEAFVGRPARIPAPPEIQGEAIAYQADGHGLFTLSEGRRRPLYHLPCTTHSSQLSRLWPFASTSSARQ